MLRVRKYLVCRSHFHEFAAVENSDAIRDAPYCSQVMGDKDASETVAAFQVGQQIQYLGLDGRIQCRNRLVRHDEGGICDHCPRNAQALALPAGQLMWVAVFKAIEANFLESFGRGCQTLVPGRASSPKQALT